MLPLGEGVPFWSFQSIDQPECAFVVTNPFWIDPEYVFELLRRKRATRDRGYGASRRLYDGHVT
ncbi:flagellar assembly protein FliW [Exiguobacterium sp. SL14]|nr:flagellar assembly protein FliW [Exiguobacterium sp. SL14]